MQSTQHGTIAAQLQVGHQLDPVVSIA